MFFGHDFKNNHPRLSGAYNQLQNNSKIITGLCLFFHISSKWNSVCLCVPKYRRKNQEIENKTEKTHHWFCPRDVSQIVRRQQRRVIYKQTNVLLLLLLLWWPFRYRLPIGYFFRSSKMQMKLKINVDICVYAMSADGCSFHIVQCKCVACFMPRTQYMYEHIHIENRNLMVFIDKTRA